MELKKRLVKHFRTRFIVVPLSLALALSGFGISTISATGKNVSSNGISHYDGVPASFYKDDKDIADSLDIDISIWDHRQDAVHFQAGTLNNGFEQGLLQKTLGSDGFPVASGKTPTYPANDFTSSSSRDFASWWTGDSRVNDDFSNHNGWEQQSLPNAFGNGTPENFYHYKDMQDFYDSVIWMSDWSSYWDITWMKTGNYVGWYNFKDGFYAPMNQDENGGTDINGFPLEYFAYNVSVYKYLADPTKYTSQDEGFVTTMTNLKYPRWYFEVDNMNDTRSDDRSAVGVGFGQYFLYNVKHRSEQPLDDVNGGLGAPGAFDQAFPGNYVESGNPGESGFDSGTFPNYNTETYSFYSAKKQTADESLVLDPVKGHLTLKYDEHTKSYVYDSDLNDYNGTSGFYPLNVGVDGVTLYDDTYRAIAGSFSHNDMTLGVKTTDGVSEFPWADELWSNELATDDLGDTLNFHFSVKGSSEFTYYGEGESFTFSGDDDFWLYINQQLVIDLGGTHGELSCTATFLPDGMVHISAVTDTEGNELAPEQTLSLGLVKGRTYSLDFFYAERHTHESNLMLSTNLTHDKFSVNKTATLNNEGTEVSYLVEVTNEMEDVLLTIVKVADWMNRGNSFNKDGEFVKFNTEGAPTIEISRDKKTWLPLDLGTPSSDEAGFKVLSHFSEHNTQEGIDLEAGAKVYFRYTYTLTEEDYEHKEIYNVFSVTTKNPKDDDAVVDVGKGGVDLDTSRPSIIKVFNVDDGVAIPNATFKFNTTPISKDGIDYDGTNMPDISDASTTYDSQSQDLLRRRIMIKLPDFSQEGTYIYRVSEVLDTYELDDDERLTYATNVYYLTMIVVDDGNNQYGLKGFEYSNDLDGLDKVETMVFMNSYTKIPDVVNETSSLIISKTIEGSEEISNQKFDFNILINAPTETTLTTFTYVIVDANGNVGAKQTGLYNANFTISLAHGEHAKFDDLLLNATYKIQEKDHANYNVSYTITNGDVVGTSQEGTDTDVQLLHEEGTRVDFVNKVIEVKKPSVEADLPSTGVHAIHQTVYTLMLVGGFSMLLFTESENKRNKRT
ncbi:hypothetical protein AOC36_03705 [Erysipelothrix larvae]|uniref:PA14 domain-containing protein n=1 Tax=Erysipelothrix larvae TaxID=1514105 RepID=A0A0X8GZ94_9FIRM|nr:fibro-slime domain-containing protein [Erysipelothrix larvae]AMC93109.1 hypothetical protein AOC36_03705 [Erysipelothrix larvae]